MQRYPRKPIRKLIARTCQDTIASLYQLSLPQAFPVIQNEASLIKCIEIGEKIADEWIIIT